MLFIRKIHKQKDREFDNNNNTTKQGNNSYINTRQNESRSLK